MRGSPGEPVLRLGHARDAHLLAGVEQVLDDHHRVISLLDRLAIEVCGKPRERLRVVVDRDRDVLLRGGELVPDLLVQSLRKWGHAPTLTG